METWKDNLIFEFIVTWQFACIKFWYIDSFSFPTAERKRLSGRKLKQLVDLALGVEGVFYSSMLFEQVLLRFHRKSVQVCRDGKVGRWEDFSEDLCSSE